MGFSEFNVNIRDVLGLIYIVALVLGGLELLNAIATRRK